MISDQVLKLYWRSIWSAIKCAWKNGT